MHTYYLDSVSWRGSDVPGALLTAGIFVRPVRAAQSPAGAVDLMLTLSCTHTHTNTRAHTRRKEVKIVAVQEKVKGNGKGTKEERKDFKGEHPGHKFREKLARSQAHISLPATYKTTAQNIVYLQFKTKIWIKNKNNHLAVSFTLSGNWV